MFTDEPLCRIEDDCGWYYEEGGDDLRFSKFYVGDFETTVFENQTSTEVWASAIVQLYTEDVIIHHSIVQTYEYLSSQKNNVCIYYHNLKFDGSFWINYLLSIGLKQAFKTDETGKIIELLDYQDYEDNMFGYLISDMGAWYKIIIKTNNHYIEIRDSLKLLPFSVERIGESFGTKHKKLTMKYEGKRFAGCVITEEEKEYIRNDVLVVKEGLEIMFNEGHNKLTIGSCCLAEYKATIGNDDYATFHPNIYNQEIDESEYGSPSIGEYVRKSYRGGWCYLVPEKSKKILTNGVTADVNSLYPSMMSQESGNLYPVGKGKVINLKGTGLMPEYYMHTNDYYYFIRLRTRFYIKKGYLPFISLKGNVMYPSNVSLTTSDVYNKKNGKYYKSYIDITGAEKEAIVELTLTQTDYILFKEHYTLVDTEYLDMVEFRTAEPIDLFDKYIERYKTIKMTSKGAKRELAKLFLNNLYGKMASSTNSSFKVAVKKDDDSIGFVEVDQFDKEPGYIPVGSAITSYARNFTIRAAQKNFYGGDKRGFVYADTDSIHCDLDVSELRGVRIDDHEFCCWKLESCWDTGWFVRAKTYIEHVTKENLKDVTPYYNVKCAGMPEKCKRLFIHSMLQDLSSNEISRFHPIEQKFLQEKRKLEDFDYGLKVPGKLLPKQIKGGVLLCETMYEMREGFTIRF